MFFNTDTPILIVVFCHCTSNGSNYRPQVLNTKANINPQVVSLDREQINWQFSFVFTSIKHSYTPSYTNWIQTYSKSNFESRQKSSNRKFKPIWPNFLATRFEFGWECLNCASDWTDKGQIVPEVINFYDIICAIRV